MAVLGACDELHVGSDRDANTRHVELEPVILLER